MSLIAVVLAAGQGTRMKSDQAKVLHTAAGRTLLGWVLEAVRGVGPDRTLVVTGHGAEQVEAELPSTVEAVRQGEQLGTGHATSVAVGRLGPMSADDTVLVVYGDMPLMTSDLLTQVVETRRGKDAALVTVELPPSNGFGRVVRDEEGGFLRVVEMKDATPAERSIGEANAGIYAFSGEALAATLDRLETDNVQKEYYLPDVLPLLLGWGGVVTVTGRPEDLIGVNSHDHLAEVEALLRRRINLTWQQEGVWMQDPERVYLDAGVRLAAGVRLYPGVHLEGETAVSEGAVIGPDVYARDCIIGSGARVWYSVLRSARVGADVDVGPYASLREGTVLEAGSKAGTFVEMKNAIVGPGAKVPHLSYMGDATIGARANVGAGSITCNYDGYDKHPTVIGEDAFIGSDTMLVAPVNVGDRAVIGAGSVVTRDVKPGALAVERSSQIEIPGYAARREERHRSRQSED
ncbi:MAG: bifunctional UDP-N-acetylglucosamine diphosphorylase/glucosamine-1-phosphate N-acetyltransferase GlmU [Actinomycetota bacterium]